MNRKECINVLHDIQKWRRGKSYELPCSPKTYGEAIDFAIRELRRYERSEVTE